MQMNLRKTASEKFDVVADVGGTNARFACLRGSRLTAYMVLRVRDFVTIEDAIFFYCKERGISEIGRFCMAVAGQVDEEAAEFSFLNNHWNFNKKELADAIGAPVKVINDFTAHALSIDALQDNDIIALGSTNEHPPMRSGVTLVIGPGTGLGVAILTPSGDILPSEGGHVGFTPTDEVEIQLLQNLWQVFDGRVSIERILSGSGIQTIYQALSPTGDKKESHEVARAAETGDLISLRAIKLFVKILGSAVGDAVLMTGADRVFLCGGVLLRLGDLFDVKLFRSRFEDKGRFADHCSRIPVFQVTNEFSGLLGCAASLDGEKDVVATAADARQGHA